MLLTQFCKLREATAVSGIQSELLTAKTSDKMVLGKKKPHTNPSNTNKNPLQNHTGCSENPRLNAPKDLMCPGVRYSHSTPQAMALLPWLLRTCFTFCLQSRDIIISMLHRALLLVQVIWGLLTGGATQAQSLGISAQNTVYFFITPKYNCMGTHSIFAHPQGVPPNNPTSVENVMMFLIQNQGKANTRSQKLQPLSTISSFRRDKQLSSHSILFFCNATSWDDFFFLFFRKWVICKLTNFHSEL